MKRDILHNEIFGEFRRLGKTPAVKAMIFRPVTWYEREFNLRHRSVPVSHPFARQAKNESGAIRCIEQGEK